MTWHIHIEGQVQGVGFRPFVFLLAKKYQLNGTVNNTTDGVHIELNATEDEAHDFYQELLHNAPNLSRITRHTISKTEEKFFDSFQIIHSHNLANANLLLTPDFALCADCRKELKDSNHHKYNYPFISCTNCGPRYSIVTKLPYDRKTTTMDNFKMCANCSKEYENPLDRRYYSQTNSCPDCQITMSLFDSQQKLISNHQTNILDQVVEFWRAGKIVAIKGIGGYLLTCDANNKTSIQTLRKRKHRPSKAFALMFPNIETLDKTINLRKTEKEVLQSSVAPIVLLEINENDKLAISKNEVAPHLNQLGILLPYAPIYELLLQKFKKPIIATSGNSSNAPIVFQDEKAKEELSRIADFILNNDRAIVLPQDDSVVKFSFFKNHKIILRRSRGLAPTYINANLKMPTKSILATGGMLKSTFSLLHQQNIYISQYLGDLANFETQENYKHTNRYFLKLFNANPQIILADKHPEYPSTQYAEEFSKTNHIPLKKIQHHLAHFGAVLGENNLIHTDSPILGVVWDGTGLGNDGQIWGGEFFKYENYDFLRCYYFDYFDFILGDKMPKEPRISAMSACWDVMGAECYLKNKFTKTEWSIYNKLLNKENPLKTSSVGRIFDAVASLLGIMDKQTYEGEAAMQLETMALQYFKKHGLDFGSSYFQEGAHYYRIPTKSLMANIVIDLQKGKAKDFIAAKFHFSLMKMIKIVANNLKIKKIAFSGGVFQNSLLVDLILHHLHTDFELFFHQELSPNDENISFGQLICHQIQTSFFQNKNKKNVFSNSR